MPAGRLAVGNAIVTRAGPAQYVQSVVGQEHDGAGVAVYNLTIEGDHTYFVGNTNGGLWAHNYPRPPNYRATFFRAFPRLNRRNFVVHHAIEQQVQDLYPGLFTYAEIHALENLRGIPKDINGWAHLSAIRQRWDGFYSAFPNATRQQIIDFAAEIDRQWGGNFVPYR